MAEAHCIVLEAHRGEVMRDVQYMSVGDLLDFMNEQIGIVAKCHADILNALDLDDSAYAKITDDISESDNAMSNISTAVENIQKKLQKVSEDLG